VYAELNGERVHFGANFIFENRAVSDELLARAIADVAKSYGGCEPISVAEYRNGGAWRWRNSGGCDLGRALNLWLSGEREFESVTPDAGMEPKPVSGLPAFAGSDEYGAPFGAKGYPNYEQAQAGLAVAKSIVRGVLDNSPPAELDKPIGEYLAGNHLHSFQ
jgi:hypothetical protein